LCSTPAFWSPQPVPGVGHPTLCSKACYRQLAVAASCRYIVTHNLRHFRGMEKWGIEAVKPSDFLKQLEKK
jgi:hypothetical protein